MFDLTMEFISGLKLGLEHMSEENEEGQLEQVIILDFLIFRFALWYS